MCRQTSLQKRFRSLSWLQDAVAALQPSTHLLMRKRQARLLSVSSGVIDAACGMECTVTPAYPHAVRVSTWGPTPCVNRLQHCNGALLQVQVASGNSYDKLRQRLEVTTQKLTNGRLDEAACDEVSQGCLQRRHVRSACRHVCVRVRTRPTAARCRPDRPCTGVTTVLCAMRMRRCKTSCFRSSTRLTSCCADNPACVAA